MAGKWWLILFILLGFSSYGQYVYTYTDPCTGVLNSVTISQPSGSVTLFYAGQYNTFTQAQLQAGAFEIWVQQINALAPPGSNPCAGSGGTITTGSNASTGTNTATNVSGIIGIATGISGNIGGSAASAGTGGISTNTGSNGSSSNNDNGNGSGGNSSSGNSSTGGSGNSGSGSSSGGGGNTGNSGGSGSNGGGSGGSGGSGSGGSGGSSGSGGSGGGQSGDNSGNGIGGGGTSGDVGTGGTGGTTETGGTDAGAVGGNESTTTASGGESESSSDGGGGGGGSKPKSKQEKIGRGSLIGSGDFVVIRNGNDIQATGMDNFRFNMSLTHINTKQNFIKGANLNYTTGENTANITLYGSYKTPTFMGIFSNSTMSNFKSDIFNTTTALAAQKTGFMTWMGGTNFTLGSLGKSSFQNWSIVGGAFTTFKGFSTFSANIMALGIYSPYIFYYEGQWYKSGVLLVPLANIDFKITNTFKWSISFSGAYQWNADILNFQLSTGAKMLL